MTNYIVKNGETITDCVLNSTGSLDNWEAILEANSFSSWTPSLSVGQSIIIPDSVIIQPNVKAILDIYPACNNSFASSDLSNQISVLIANFGGVIVFRADNNLTATMDSTILTADQNI